MSDDMLDMLLDQAGRLFSDGIDRDLLASVEAGQRPAALEEAVNAFGFADMLVVSREDGGLGFADAAALFALFGKYAVPLPLGETILARALLVRAGIEAPMGAIGLAGSERCSLAFGDQLGAVVLHRDGQLVLISLDGVASTASAGISRQPRAGYDLSGVTPIATAPWPALPHPDMLGAMLRASQIAGAVERALDLSIDYANVRKQFGRPIGRFQAIQQLLAKLAAETAAARSACDVAWATLDTGNLGVAGMIAKIRAGQAARAATAIAHQVHGAIGVTDEHFLHYVTRRLWEWRLDYGSDGQWAARLGALSRSAPGGLWPFLTTQCGISASARA